MKWEDGYTFWCWYRDQKDACYVYVTAPNDEPGYKMAEDKIRKTAAVRFQYTGFCRRLIDGDS